MTNFECEQKYVQDYVRNLFKSAGVERTRCMASVAWAAGTGNASLVTGIAPLYYRPGDDGEWETNGTFWGDGKSKVFVGSLTVQTNLSAYTSGNPAVEASSLQVSAGSQLLLGPLLSETFTGGAVTARRALNIPFIAFNALVLNNSGGSSSASLQAKFDGWFVNGV